MGAKSGKNAVSSTGGKTGEPERMYRLVRERRRVLSSIKEEQGMSARISCVLGLLLLFFLAASFARAQAENDTVKPSVEGLEQEVKEAIAPKETEVMWYDKQIAGPFHIDADYKAYYLLNWVVGPGASNSKPATGVMHGPTLKLRLNFNENKQDVHLYGSYLTGELENADLYGSYLTGELENADRDEWEVGLGCQFASLGGKNGGPGGAFAIRGAYFQAREKLNGEDVRDYIGGKIALAAEGKTKTKGLNAFTYNGLVELGGGQYMKVPPYGFPLDDPFFMIGLGAGVGFDPIRYLGFKLGLKFQYLGIDLSESYGGDIMSDIYLGFYGGLRFGF